MTTATVARQREMGRIGKQPKVKGTIKQGRSAMLGAISAAARETEA